jgi:hypothetical protein
MKDNDQTANLAALIDAGYAPSKLKAVTKT